MTAWPFAYAPGGLVGFATDGLLALVDLPTDDELVARIAAIVSGEAPTLDAVLDVLVSRGLRAVATFGLAELGPDAVRVLVRGDCRAVTADRAATAEGLGLWAEETWPGVQWLRLVADDADSRTLPLAGGIVLASALGLGAEPLPVPAVVAQALEPEPEPETEPELPAAAEPGGATLSAPLTGPVPPAEDEPEPAASGGIIDALPWTLDDAQAPTQVAGPLPVLRARGGGPETLVVAVTCPDGHPNPVHATTCRFCGARLSAQQPVEVPRPSLGVLRLANGDVVALERGAVLGRNPHLPQGWVGEQPHLVRIDDPDRDVSSQHLEVRLDGWHVLVRDLGSTNGTEVALPGSEPVLLRAHEQLSIEPGTRLLLAGAFAVTYEAVA